MKIKLFSFLFIVLSLHAFGQKKKSKVQDRDFVRASGAVLTVHDKDTIQLKGTNIGNWLVPEGYMFKFKTVNSPRKIDEMLYELVGPDSLQRFWKTFTDNYIRYEDIKYLKSIGCNHIRLPFHYQLFTQDYYLGGRNQGFVYFDRIIEWCRNENLYVLLDMHCAPGGQTGDNIDDSYAYPYLYSSPLCQKEMSSVWQQIAEKYKNDTIVLGYDLINEPVAHYFADEKSTMDSTLLSIYKMMIKDIRKIDKRHLIFVNGSNWSTDLSVFTETLGDNIVYEFHKYWMDAKQEELMSYLDFQQKHKVPIYIGETGENTDEWVLTFRKLLDVNKINWCFWPYKKMNNTKGIMNFEQPALYDLLVQYSNSDRSSYEKTRGNRPNRGDVNLALKQYLDNCLFENCFQNKGYIEGLGFKSF